MARAIFGIDVSQFSGEIAANDWRRAQAAGLRHAVVKLSTFAPWARALAVRQLRAAVEAGLSVSGYLWCEWADPPDAQVDAGLAIADEAGAGLSVLWLDAEHGEHLGAERITGWLRRAADHCRARGVKAGLYTGHWWWHGRLGNPTDLADLPLWTAQYDGIPDLHRGLTYGGWRHPFAGKQYQGTTRYQGIHCDLNVFSEEVTRPMTTRETPDETRETPDDYPFADWRQSAIAYRGALDAMGQELEAARAALTRDLPPEYTERGWGDWYVAGVNLRAIADQLGQDLAALRGELADARAELERLAGDLDALAARARGRAAERARGEG